MKSKLIVSALLAVLLFVSCNSESNLNWFKESLSATEGADLGDPNRDSVYFDITGSGTISPKADVVLPADLLIPLEVDGIAVQRVTGCEESTVRNLSIPGGVRVSAGAFFSCSFLENVVLYGGVVSVGENAFLGCGALERVEVYCSYSAVSPGAFSESCTADFVYNGVTYEGYADFRALSNE